MQKPRIVAHRGGAAAHPENALAAFRDAATLGIEEAECDVHLTGDGELLVLHDATLDQTTLGRGPASALRRAERHRTRLRGGDEPVPTLPKVLAVVWRSALELRIEIKLDAAGTRYPGMDEAIADAIHAEDMKGRVTLISFDRESLLGLAREGYRTSLCLSGFRRVEGLADRLRRLRDDGIGDVGASFYEVDRWFLDAAASAGLTAGVWTVNGPSRLAYWLGMDVAYVTTDQPGLARSLRDGAAAVESAVTEAS